MNIKNLDHDEVNKFDELAAKWWDLEGEFKPLHQINPLRVGFIKQRSTLAGKKVLDVGCGGGILSEALSELGAVEIIWTLVPCLILIVMAVPSFKVLYSQDTIPKADVTIKAIGYQWYWGYEYPDENIIFDSYMIEEEDLKEGQPRLLAVDNVVVVVVMTLLPKIVIQ